MRVVVRNIGHSFAVMVDGYGSISASRVTIDGADVPVAKRLTIIVDALEVAHDESEGLVRITTGAEILKELKEAIDAAVSEIAELIAG
ncbi:MAG: hypothetical protein QXZ31_07105 [Thermofilaceae archaeon]